MAFAKATSLVSWGMKIFYTQLFWQQAKPSGIYNMGVWYYGAWSVPRHCLLKLIIK